MTRWLGLVALVVIALVGAVVLGPAHIALSDLAFLATWESRHEDAIRLAAASTRLKERIGGPPGGFAGILEGDPVDAAAPHLDANAMRRAWDEGTEMSLEEAIRLAERESRMPSKG